MLLSLFCGWLHAGCDLPRWDTDLRLFRNHSIGGSAYKIYLTQLRLFWKKLPPARGEEQTSMKAILRLLVFENLTAPFCRLWCLLIMT